MVFQSYAIWPHMTVYENAAFPLQVRGAGPAAGGGASQPRTRLSRRDIKEKVMRVLTAVQLDHLADRDATKLSGGQQQRLALARALVMEPALLLLDEPLSNLDAKLREKMRFELKRLQRELKITTVYVTHDQSEALALSHQIAVMNEGRIQQIGTPREIYEQPGSQFVADFVGNTNFIEGVLTSRLKPASTIDTASPLKAASTIDTASPLKPASTTDTASRLVPTTGVGAGFSRLIIRTELGDVNVYASNELDVDAKVAISIRPEDVDLKETRPSGNNVWEGRVEQKVFLGEAVDFRVKVGSRTLLSRQHPTLRTKVGESIFVHLDPEKCVVLKIS
jgi:iron(III) transport system ATP-binding protein